MKIKIMFLLIVLVATVVTACQSEGKSTEFAISPDPNPF